MHVFLEIVTNDIIPVMLVALAGWLLARRFQMDARILSQVGINALLPCLIFQTLSTTPVNLFDSARVALFCALVVILAGALAWLVSAWLRLNTTRRTALMLAVMFTNVGNFGIPVVAFAFGEQALAHATVYLVTMNFLLYTLGVGLLAGGRLNWKGGLASLLREPIIYSIFLAILVKQFHIAVPGPAARAISLLGQGAVPVMLLVLGMRFSRAKIEWSSALGWAVALRLVFVPLAAFPLAAALQLAGPALQAGMLQAATPTGVSTILLASEYDIEPDFVNSAIFLTTLLCAVTMTPVILIFQGAG